MCARDKLLSEDFAMPTGKKPDGKNKLSKIAQYYRLKQKHNLLQNGVDPTIMDRTNEKVYKRDWLAVMTAYTKLFFQIIVQLTSKLHAAVSRYLPETSKIKKMVTPSILIIMALLVISKQNPSSPQQNNKIWKMLYILSFSIHFGAQFWMTFVSGIVLYFSLPRHVFGLVQEIIFPFYFLFNSITSFATVVSFINIHRNIPLHSEIFKQIIALTVSLCIEVLIRLYVAQVIVMLKQKKTRIETEAGTGQEIGHQVLGELVNCPHYMGILRKFRRYHSYTSIATIITFLCSLYHLNFLIDTLCL